MKIMIVDDNALMRSEISKSVIRNNDAVLECNDGSCAIENCVGFAPDWILMDIRMKKMNGFIASEKIKKIMPGAKIAIVTSYDDYSYRKRAEALGIEYYFLKTNLMDIRPVLEKNRDDKH